MTVVLFVIVEMDLVVLKSKYVSIYKITSDRFNMILWATTSDIKYKANEAS